MGQVVVEWGQLADGEGTDMPMRPWIRGQRWLMPPSLDELVPPSHPVRFLAEFVDQLVPSALGLSLETAERGGVAYDPRMMLAAWIYGFMMRVRASRRLEVAAQENLPLIWLLGGQHPSTLGQHPSTLGQHPSTLGQHPSTLGQHPDHSTLARFLAAHHQVLHRLFKQTVRTAVDVGLVAFAFQAVDGTRVSAVSRDKMLDREALEALDQRVDEAIARLERSVADEEQGAPADPAAQEMPAALRNPEELKARVRVALAKVDERQESRASHHTGATDPQTGQPRGPQAHLADPGAVVMKGRHGYVAGYNAQAAVDAQARVIVAADVIAQATDHNALVPMLEQMRENTGRLAAVTALDGGYHSAANLEAVAAAPTDLYLADPNLKRQSSQGERAAFHKDAFAHDSATDTYRCPMGQTPSFEYVHGGQAAAGNGERVYRCHACGACPQRDPCTTDRHGRRIRVRPENERLRAHRAKMRTPEARERMRQRGATVEPVFGIMREHMGLTRFLRRGLATVRAEWHLLCAAFNLRVIWKARSGAPQQVAAAT